jgi:hypothetical protein
MITPAVVFISKRDLNHANSRSKIDHPKHTESRSARENQPFELHVLPRRTIRFFMKPFIRRVAALAAFAICTVASSSFSAANELADIKSEITIEHIKLMIDAGLIEGEADPHPEMATGGIFVISNRTWAGHDFLGSLA